MHLFTYGTLMVPEIWESVVGARFEMRPGSVLGYAVYRVIAGVYPVMVAADATLRVDGVVYLDLDDRTVQLLDEYESDLYDRILVDAIASDATLTCHAYVLPKARWNYSSGETWDVEWFRREALDEYLRRLRK